MYTLIHFYSEHFYGQIRLLFLHILPEKQFHDKRVIAVRYHFTSVPLLTPLFHRLLGAAITTWEFAQNHENPIMTWKMGAFIIDNFHRAILLLDQKYIVLLISHRQGNVNINPWVSCNVQRFVNSNLRRILSITSAGEEDIDNVSKKDLLSQRKICEVIQDY